MNKKAAINTGKAFLILFVLLSQIFTGCGKKNEEEIRRIAGIINDISFEMARYSLTGVTDNPEVKKLFYPKELDLYAGRSYWKNCKHYYAIERYFPGKIGIIEGSLFYNPYDEKADWVEDLVIRVEEERIAGEILAMEDALEEAEYVPEEYSEQIERALSDEIETISRVGRDNKLKIMEYDNEIFMPQEREDCFVTIDSDGNLIKRSYFDAEYRLVKKEYWKINNHSDGKLTESEEFVFDEESYRPKEKSYRNEDGFTKTEYNEDGLAIHSVEYKTVERKKESKKTRKVKTTNEDVITAEYNWSYNEDNKIDTQLCTLFFYDEEYKTLEYSFVKKYLYMYNDFAADKSDSGDDENKDIPPDFEYYENDVLKMKNKYTAELGTYTSQVYFENDFTVKTYYEKYKKVKDVYAVGKVVKRVKKYE